MGHFKDAILAQLAETANVAQFISFGPGNAPAIRYARLREGPPQEDLNDVFYAITQLLNRSNDRSVNIRTFTPDRPKSRAFHYGLTNPRQVAALVTHHAAEGLYTIVNETINIADSGVSGVLLGEVLEFVPGDTPRGVEKSHVCSLHRDLGLSVLRTVYGFVPDLDYKGTQRVEFSIHPRAVGIRSTHTLVWEIEDVEEAGVRPRTSWPNVFSRFVGDKTFGLLLAHLVGLRVPETLAVPRSVAPFRFGLPTGTCEAWLRTAPREPTPGKYTSTKKWIDPYRLMQEEDPSGDVIGSLLFQDAVAAQWSGASEPAPSRGDTIEGVEGEGDQFMLGAIRPTKLPPRIVADVAEVASTARSALGQAVRLEWVHDGDQAWVVQLRLATELPATPGVFYSGHADEWLEFDPDDGLDVLRTLVNEAIRNSAGIEVTQPVGVTSHVGDVLRKARIPSRLAS